jgi:hypothetical protein
MQSPQLGVRTANIDVEVAHGNKADLGCTDPTGSIVAVQSQAGARIMDNAEQHKADERTSVYLSRVAMAESTMPFLAAASISVTVLNIIRGSTQCVLSEFLFNNL